MALKNGTNRTASVIALTKACLIRIDKSDFDLFVKDDLENQLQDQIEFMLLCPIFHKIAKQTLVELCIRNENVKFTTGKEIFTGLASSRIDFIYIVRRGSVKVVKEVKFCKNESLKTKKSIKTPYKLVQSQEVEQDKIIEKLSEGPSEKAIEEGNYKTRNVVIETLKLGDIFPTYYAFTGNYLDVQYVADSPSEFIKIKLADMIHFVKEAYDFIEKYIKPYPEEKFLRRFYYFNSIWIDYRKTVKQNIMVDVYNKEM